MLKFSFQHIVTLLYIILPKIESAQRFNNKNPRENSIL